MVQNKLPGLLFLTQLYFIFLLAVSEGLCDQVAGGWLYNDLCFDLPPAIYQYFWKNILDSWNPSVLIFKTGIRIPVSGVS